MRILWQNLTYAVRVLRGNPGFAGAAILTLALGIGANTAIFNLSNALLFTVPDGIVQPEQVVSIGRTRTGADFLPLSYPDYADFRASNRSFADLAAFRETTVVLSATNTAEPLAGMLVSGNYFSVLGARAERGRVIGPDDDGPTEGRDVAVVSDGLWRRRFGADPHIVGRVIELNDRPFTIVGVTAAGFTGTNIVQPVDLWVPLATYARANPTFVEDRLASRQISWLGVLGRLRAGVGLEQAQLDLARIARQLETAYPNVDRGWGVTIAPELGIAPELRDEARTRMGILLGIGGLVLLVVCGNIATLFLARGEVRRREFAVRRALGASRGRLAGQVLTESIVLSLIGGAVGVLVALWSRALLLRSDVLTGVRLPAASLRLDLRVLAFAAAASAVTGVLVGILPALGVTGRSLTTLLRDRSAGGMPRGRIRSALVAAEIALSVVVLICAGLFVRTLQNATAVEPGFDADRIVSTPIDVGRRGYSEARGREFYRRALERTAALPGASDATLSVTNPLAGSWRTGVRRDDQPTSEPDIPCEYDLVAPHYFSTMGITLRGRDFAAADQPTSPGVVIVNETLARRVFPGIDPIGKRLAIPRYPGDTARSEIIAVAKDIKYERLTESPRMYFYLPLSQRYQPGVFLFVRSATSAPAQLAASVTQAVAELDQTAVFPGRILADRLQASLAPQRSAATLLGILAVLAVVIASVGLYGVLAYTVGQRQQEIGLRMALGARVADVLALVFKQGAALIVSGVFVGVAASRAILGILTTQLFGLSASDPAVYSVAVGLLVATAVLACYLPARHAARIDPLQALRRE